VTRLDREANVLGALALVLADQTAGAVAGVAGQSASAAAALSALHQFLDRPTIERLRQVLGLTPSGAVRLVDRLVGAGLVARGPGEDGRSRSVSLTPRGRRVAARVSAARAATLSGALAGLSAKERTTLGGLLDRVMANVVQAKDGGAWICRLCDLTACERAEGHCPAANAAREKYGPP
jgi:DNA-binding MarR family transcriptional regulator